MNLYTINTGFFKLDGGAMFGVVPKSIWDRLNPADEHNLCSWALRCLLVEDGGRLILIDNGLGNKQDENFFKHYYLHGEDILDASLARHGFQPGDITDVLLTHLHFDHCGGSIVRRGEELVPAFANAIYWSNQLHWDWAVNPNDRERASFLKENILPMQESGQLHMIETTSGRSYDMLNFSENIKLRLVYGHTEAMMLPQISYQGRTIVYVTDLLPSIAHIPIPYVMAYDMFPLTSMQEKKSFLEEAVKGDYILFFEHDPLHECCNLQMTAKGIRSKESFALKDIGAFL